MKSWPTKQLGELVTLEYGKALKAEDRSENRGFPVYGSNGVVGSHNEAVIREPTIVVGRKGAIGEAHLAENGCWPIDTTFYTQFRQRGVVSLQYLLFGFVALTSNRNTLYAQQVPTPPLVEQERIVRLLDEADELRKLRTEGDRRMADLIPALFNEMFGDPETNPKGWPRGTLQDFGVNVRYGLGQPPAIDTKGVPLLRATNIKRGLISEEGLIRVSREAVPVSRNAFLKADDVVVVRSGAYTGDVARVGDKWAGSVAGYDLVISPNEQFTGEFLASFLLT